jgi:hypothetical protein
VRDGVRGQPGTWSEAAVCVFCVGGAPKGAVSTGSDAATARRQKIGAALNPEFIAFSHKSLVDYYALSDARLGSDKDVRSTPFFCGGFLN